MVDCKFCGSQIYLPDDLWFRLHPVKSVERWFMLVGEGEASVAISGMPAWEDVNDLTIDEQGNLYVCSDDGTVWSLDPDLKTRWVRAVLPPSKEMVFSMEAEGRSGLTLTHDGDLYLWIAGKRSLLRLSSKDGSTVRKIEGKAPSKEDPCAFSLKGCGALVSDRDGSILALIQNTVARYNAQGERLQLWKGKKFGLFSSGVGDVVPEGEAARALCVKEIGSCPKRVQSEFTRLNMGWDGYLYFMDRSSSDANLAKYSSDGKQLWSRPIPLEEKQGKPWADTDGNVYILGTTEKSQTHLVKYSPGTGKFETLLTDVVEGGVLHEEEHLAVSRDGRIFVADRLDRMKVFSPRLEMIYRSKRSEEHDREALDEMKGALVKEEDFG
jgi:outer membrane protein assembly factor BamB